MDGPLDLRLLRSQFANSAAFRVQAVDPKTRGLAFQSSGCIAIKAGRLGRGIGNLWSNVEIVLAVAKPRDTDARIDRGFNNAVVARRGRRFL